MSKNRAINRTEPRDYCKTQPDEVTLMLEGLGFWFTFKANGVAQDVLDDIIPTGSTREAYVWHEDHGLSISLTAAQGWALHDRMESEGGHSAFLRARGLLR
jgi:hypothetical protein